MVFLIAEDPLEGGGERRIKIDTGRDLPIRGDIEVPEGIFTAQGDLSRRERGS